MGKGHGKLASAVGERNNKVAHAVGAVGKRKCKRGHRQGACKVVCVQLQGTQGVRFCMGENTHLYFFQA